MKKLLFLILISGLLTNISFAADKMDTIKGGVQLRINIEHVSFNGSGSTVSIRATGKTENNIKAFCVTYFSMDEKDFAFKLYQLILRDQAKKVQLVCSTSKANANINGISFLYGQRGTHLRVKHFTQ